MQSISPVFTDAEVQFEREIAKTQPEYSAIIGLPVTLQIIDPASGESKLVPDWGISVRFRLSPEEKAQLAAGCDLVVTQLTFGNPFAPMNLQFCPAKTKPVFDLAAEPPRVDPSAADLDEFTEAQKKLELARAHTASICPSCGETDKLAPAACANTWHSEGVEKVLTEPAKDQPQSDV